MIIGILLTIFLGGGVGAVGAFLLKFLIFWAVIIVLMAAIVLGVVLYQNHVPRHKNKRRRAEDKL